VTNIDQNIVDEINHALDILELPKLITKADIKKQYRFLSKKNHPDLGGYEHKQEEINWAYRLLMKYIEEFRYTFEDKEIYNQLPGADHARRFKP